MWRFQNDAGKISLLIATFNFHAVSILLRHFTVLSSLIMLFLPFLGFLRTNRKPLPQLPIDVWFRISTYLDPASLSALSQVNHALNAIATDEAHFRRHHSIPHNSSMHPAQHYRRSRALSFVPSLEASIRLPDHVNILCAVEDTLLLHNANTSRIVAFPGGAEVDIAELLDPEESGLSWLYLKARTITLPGPNIGFRSAVNPALLAVLNVNRWEVTAMNMGAGMKSLIVGTVHGKPTMLAGNNGEWVIYYTDEGSSRRIIFVDWRNGAVMNEITDASRSLKFVMGECPAVDGMTVVGVVSESSDGFTREVHIMSFDGECINFRFSPDQDVEAVLRSKDTNTHVLIVSTMCAHNVKRMSLIWSHADKDSVMSGGRSLPTTTVPELRENGSVIVANYGSSFSQVDGSLTRPTEDWIFLNNHGETEFLERCTIKVNKHRTAPKWLRRTPQGGLAVTLQKKTGNLDLVNFELKRDSATGSCLKKWSIPGGVNNMCIVADHFVVMSGLGKRLGRRLHLLHFDRFCHGGTGVYACPRIFRDGYFWGSNDEEG